MNDYERKVAALAAKIEAETVASLRKRHPAMSDRVYQAWAEVNVKPGTKYTRLDVGNSGKYMVDRDGNIFGIKAYGVVHKGHYYGTLDTIDQWYWGNYTAVRAQAVKA